MSALRSLRSSFGTQKKRPQGLLIMLEIHDIDYNYPLCYLTQMNK